MMSFRYTRILICRGGLHAMSILCSQHRTSLPIGVVQTQTGCLALTWTVLYVPDPAFPWNRVSFTFLDQD